MAYTSGDVILDDHYNIFATGSAAGTATHTVANLNTIWTGDAATYGWGQSGALSAVSAGTTITATQWTSLLNRMNTIASHEGVSITSITNPATSDTISAYTALSTNITTLYNNRGDAFASGTDITTNGTVSGTGSWDVSAATTKTVTFSSAAAANYFFNAGGMIRISTSRSGGTASAKNTEWTDLLSQCGTFCLTGGALTQTIAGTNYSGSTKIGGSGTPSTLTASIGWHDLTAGGAATSMFAQYADSTPYTGNYYRITAAKSANGAALTLSIELYDTAADTVSPTGDAAVTNLDIVDGTLTCNVVVRPPSTTYISNTWGTPTMAATSWTYSS